MNVWGFRFGFSKKSSKYRKHFFAARVGNLNSTCRVSISEINSHLKQILANQDVIIKQNSELTTKLDKLLNKTTCEGGGEHPFGGEA